MRWTALTKSRTFERGNYMYRYILIFLLTLPVLATGQSLRNSNFTWVAQQAQNLASGTIQEQHAVFNSYGIKKFEMIQHSATVVFTVTSQQGAWKDISQEGETSFSVQIDNQHGTITVGRNSEGPYLILDMTPSRPDGINFKYFISSLTVHE
jgi:hypothetical protein